MASSTSENGRAVERESMEVDVLYVGAGPGNAGLERLPPR